METAPSAEEETRPAANWANAPRSEARTDDGGPASPWAAQGMKGAFLNADKRILLPGECCNERHQATYAVADHVKVEIGNERLWLLVRRCDERRRLVFGTLDSEPSNDYDGQVVLGSELVVSFSKIREHEKRDLDEDGGGK